MKILLIGFNIQEDVYPLALSYLKSYSSKFHKDVDIKIKEFSTGNRIDNAVNKTIELQVVSYILLENPDVVGFSCYIWNIKTIRTICQILKRTNPKIKIMLGGVEVTSKALEYSDFIIQGEGEIATKELIDYLKGNIKIEQVSNIAYKKNNKIIQNKKTELDSLDKIPNPYNYAPKTKYTTIRIETSRGCPFNCKYCYYATAKKIRYFSKSYLKKLITYVFTNYNFKYLTIIDANVNVNKKHMKYILDLIQDQNKKIKVAFELKPELIDEEVINILENYKFEINAELGLQSTNSDVLSKCTRTFDLEKVKQGLNLLNKSKINYKIDLMYGLPEDNFLKFLNSARFLLNNAKKQNQLPAHHFMLLNNTEFTKDLSNRIDDEDSSMILGDEKQSIIDLFTTKLFVEQLNEELKLKNGN